MKKEYFSPEWDFVSISIIGNIMTVSTGEDGASGGDDGPGGGGGFGDGDE